MNAQEIELANHQFYELADGLQSRIILQIEMDENRYYWLLLKDGVQIFDGQNFIHKIDFPKVNYIIRMYSDSTSIFLTTADHKILEYKDFRSIPKVQEIDTSKVIGRVSTFSKNEESHNYFSTCKDNYTYFYKNPADPTLIDSIYSEEEIFDWLSYDEGICWINNTEIMTFRKDDNNLTFGENLSNAKYRYVPLISDIGDGITFSFPFKQGVYHLNKSKKIDTLNIDYNLGFISQDKSGSTIYGLADDAYRYISKILVQDKAGNQNDYSSLLDIKNTLIDVYTENINESMLLASYNGFYQLTFNSGGIKNIYARPNTPPSHFGNIIRDIAADDEGNMYLVREGGVFLKYTIGGELEDIGKDPIFSFGLLQVKMDKINNCLWLSTFSKDRTSNLIKYDLQTKKSVIRKYPFIILKITVDQNNLLYLTGREDRTGKFAVYDIAKDSLTYDLSFNNQEINHALKIDNELWIAGDKGIIIKDLSSLKENLLYQFPNAEYIQKLDQYVFVSSHGSGVYVFENDKLIKILDKNCCLENNEVAGILQDQNGNYWISTFNGISILNNNFEPIYYINTYDGLSSNEFNTGSLAQDHEYLYFGSINGVTRIDPDYILSDTTRSPFFRKKVNYFKDYIRSDLDIQTNEIIGIPDSIEVTLDLQGPMKGRNNLSKLYTVEISPEDTKYSFTNNRIFVQEPKVGDLQIKIRSRLNNKLFSIASLSIHRDRYLLFRAVLFIGAISIMAYLLSSYLISLNRKKEEEKTAINKRISEVELEALRSQMNPHFIFNSLGAIQYYILTNEKKLAGKYLSKFAKLMRLFLDASKSKEVNLERTLRQINLYLELEQLRYENKFDYNVQVDDKLHQLEDTIPSMLLQPFIENSIIHGVNHKENGKGYIQIIFTKEDDHILCVIEDNGIGREKAKEIKENKITLHKSRATQMINERVELLKKTGHRNIELKYEDKKDEQGNATGTKVILKFSQPK